MLSRRLQPARTFELVDRRVVSQFPEDDIAKAWRNASDYDVASALKTPDDYPAHVNEIIQDEARCRGLEEDGVEPLDPLPAERAATYVGESARQLVPRLVRSPLLHAAVLAIVISSLARLMPLARSPAAAIAMSVIVALAFWDGLAWICRPLRSYRLVLTACGVCAVFVKVGAQLIQRLGSDQLIPAIDDLQWVADVVSIGTRWAVFCLPLCLIVFLRNKYWPAPGEGHCQACGYELQGLPEPRCPECGEAF